VGSRINGSLRVGIGNENADNRCNSAEGLRRGQFKDRSKSTVVVDGYVVCYRGEQFLPYGRGIVLRSPAETGIRSSENE
jgi:hypothetical protein